MRLFLTARFMRSYDEAPQVVKKAFQKQSRFLLDNIRHPSLHAKKYNEAEDRWQARVNRDWRLYFTISGDTYYVVDILKHPK